MKLSTLNLTAVRFETQLDFLSNMPIGPNIFYDVGTGLGLSIFWVDF